MKEQVRVRLTKVHPIWEGTFSVGDELDLISGKTIVSLKGVKYDAIDLCRCFSNHCSFSDIMERI